MSASIFNADTVKILKDKLQFKSGGKITSQGSVDPTAVATDGSVGDIYINTTTGIVYNKLIAGLNTSWASIITSDVNQILNSPVISNVVPPAPQTGNLWMTDTLNVKLANSTLQVGQEMYVASLNNTGAPIAEASLVYQSGFSAGVPLIAKAQANSEVTHKVVGMATNTISNGDPANITTYGLVRDINTVNDSEGNALAAGDVLYLSATVAGGYTKNVPLNSYYAIEIGYVNEAAVSGSIFININHDHARDLSLVTKEPTGFDVPANVTVTYDPTAKTITLGGTFNVYWRGSLVTAITTGHVSVAHPATLDKIYYYYFDGINLVWSESIWTFDMVMIAIVQYGTTNKFAIRECHGLMDWNTHQEFHRVIGTYRSGGGTLSNYTLASTVAANRRPDVSSCTVNDEDVPTVNPALTSKLYTKMVMTGNTTTPVVAFTVETADFLLLNGEIPYYNQLSGVNWVQTPMSDNQYQAIWLIAVPVTLGTDSQKYRYLWMQGQSVSTTLSTIQALTPSDLSLGNLAALSPEYVFITKIIIRYDSNPSDQWQIISVSDLTGNKFIQSSAAAGVYLSAVEHDASLTGDGTAANPLATAYTPATPANWDVGADPATPNDALDKIASQGVVKKQVKNTSMRGPTTGLDALPTFRTPVGEDFAPTPTLGHILTSSGILGAPVWEARNPMAAANSTATVDLSLYRSAIYFCNPSAAITLTLSDVGGAARDGSVYTFKNISAFVVTIDPNSTDTIDGSSTSYTLNPMESVTFAVYAAGLYII